MCHPGLSYCGRVRCIHRLKSPHWKVRGAPGGNTRNNGHLGHNRRNWCISELRGDIFVGRKKSLLLHQLVLVHFQLILLCLDLTMQLLLLFLKLNSGRKIIHSQLVSLHGHYTVGFLQTTLPIKKLTNTRVIYRVTGAGLRDIGHPVTQLTCNSACFTLCCCSSNSRFCCSSSNFCL